MRRMPHAHAPCAAQHEATDGPCLQRAGHALKVCGRKRMRQREAYPWGGGGGAGEVSGSDRRRDQRRRVCGSGWREDHF